MSILGIYALHLTHPSAQTLTHRLTHTHTHTHTRSSGQPMLQHPGLRCLAQGHLSRGIEGGESTGQPPPPPTIPDGPKLEPAILGFKSNSLSIRPQPPNSDINHNSVVSAEEHIQVDCKTARIAFPADTCLLSWSSQSLK